jgi:non-homologous end joining protein Ku
MDLGLSILKKLSKDLDMREFKDSFREKIETLVQSKINGEVISLEKKADRSVARGLMDELRATAESLK